MGFFDDRPAAPPPPEPVPPAWEQPETVLPGVVPEPLFLARTDDVAVALTDLRAFPSGFGFTLVAVTRVPGSARLPRHRGPGPVPADLLRFGLRFADGTVLTNLDTVRPGPDAAGPLLVPRGGTGGRQRIEQTFWVWPLPPPGRVDVVCEWPAQGIAETTVGLDAEVILAAARRAVALF